MIEKRTVCPFDCPDCCGIIASIENGKVVAVRGDDEHPRTQGFLCRKMNHYEEMINHPNRILYPLKRTGKKGEGQFERISWEEAITSITDQWKKIIKEYGAQALIPYYYAGTEGILQQHCGKAFFNYMGASKLVTTLCSSGKGAGWKAVMGNTLGMPAYKLGQCDRILVWSSNIAATRIHEIPYIKEAREKGAKVTLIDVYETPAAAHCDDTILVKAGTDGALALSMIYVMEKEGLTDHAYIEENVQGYDLLLKELPMYAPEKVAKITGVDAETIRELALSYGKAERPGILLGSGASRNKAGAMLVRCIAALPAVVGSWKKGFGISGIKQTGEWGDRDRIHRSDFAREDTRSLNMMQLASILNKEKTNPPIMGIYIYSCNPVAVTTNIVELRKQMEREDLFTVVHERFMTDTAKYADIILPATFSVEHYDFFHGYGMNSVQYSKKIVEAPGECCSNWETLQRLAAAMGFEDEYFKKSEEEICLEYLQEKTGQLAELTQEEMNRVLEGYAVEKRLSGCFDIATPSGKIELYNPMVADPLICYKDMDVTDRYPLHLVAAPSLYTLNSTFTTQEGLTKKRGRMTLIVSQVDAKARGIEEGDLILCENELAQVTFYADVRDNILPGTVVAEGIYIKDQTIDGNNVNALFSEDLSDLGESTTICGNFVQILRK
ncbi:MAG: molybdopterin-dependent oxidoreductase [Eubacteriales bacterium]|nr:molybdopterin-dependent oxidoreductase [Eubacteriales bacterium]